MDFGIAQALDAASVTKTGMMVGSASFMAPEQISGRPGQAADIFVWGVTVAYAATGQSPFGTGDTNAVLYRVLHADPDIGAVPARSGRWWRPPSPRENTGRPPGSFSTS